MTKKTTKHKKERPASNPLRQIVFVVAILLAVVIFLQYLVLPIFLKQARVREYLIAAISKETQGTVQFSALNLRVFPSLSFRIRDLAYESQDKETPLVFSAKLFQAKLSLFSLIQKKIRLKSIAIKQATLEGKTRLLSEIPAPFSLKNFTVDAKGIRDKSLGSFRAKGKLFSETGHFEITGRLHLGDLARFKLEDALCDLTFKFSHVPLEPLVAGWHKTLPLKIVGGQLSGLLQVVKKTPERKGEWESQLEFENMLFADPSNPDLSLPKTSYQLASKGGWDLGEGGLHLAIQSSRLLSQGLTGELIGDFKLTDRGLSDFNLHISFDEFDFDRVNLQYLLLSSSPWKELKLTGKGEVRFQARGNRGAFILHGETVLSDAGLESRYFTKPAGVPLNFTSDVRLDEKGWHGTFELHYRELKAKGTLLKWDPPNQQLEFTFLTNKFRFATFLEAIPTSAAAQYWRGDVKVLLNYKGKPIDPENARIYGVINLDNLTHRLPDFPFHTPPLTATLKIENTELYSEKSSFDLGDGRKARFQLEWNGWYAPRIEWKFTSETLPLDIVLKEEETESPQTAEEKEKRSGIKPAEDMTRHTEKTLQVTLPLWLERAKAYGEIETADLKLGNVSLGGWKTVVLLEKGRWQMLPAETAGRKGSFWMEASQDWHTEAYPTVQLGGRGIQMADSFLEGNIFFEMDNHRIPSLFDGSLLIHKGGFKNFSLLSSAETALGGGVPASGTAFQELGAHFQLGVRGIDFSEGILLAKELSANGSGSWRRSDGIRFTGSLMLNKEESRRFKPELSSNERLVLAYGAEGSLEKPLLKIDGASKKQMLEKEFLSNSNQLLDELRRRERQGLRKVSVPDKTKFLEQPPELLAEEEAPKGGFFENLFGRRN